MDKSDLDKRTELKAYAHAAGSAAQGLYRRSPIRRALPLLLIAMLAFGVFSFVQIADEVMEGETRAFDEQIILAMRQAGDTAQPVGPYWLPETARDVTSFGSTFALIFISLVVVGWLLISRKPHGAVLLTVSLIGGSLLGNGLKWFFDRPRPDLVAHGAEVFTLSFPSSHAMMATTVYLTLGVLVMRLSESFAAKAYALLVPLLLSVLIGVSRVYLGVHWPTDVIAGWAIGAAWAALVWLVALWLQQRGQVETAA